MKSKLNHELGNYYLDLDAIFEYCQEKTHIQKRNNDFVQKEISDSYELDDNGKLTLSQKLVHEVVTPVDAVSYDEEKFDIIKSLIAVVISSEEECNTNLLTPSVSLAFNTLLNKGFVKE